MILLASCNPHPGFDETESGIFKRLDQFGDCSPSLSDADYFIAEIKYASIQRPDSGYQFQLHHHALHKQSAAIKDTDPPGLRLLNELDSIHCGDRYTFIIPFSEIDNCYLSAFADTSSFKPDEEMEFSIHVLKTFTENEYASYLMHAAQQQEMEESEAIELLLMNDTEFNFEKHGDCFIQYLDNATSDSILPGKEIRIQYNTFLLDQKRLDSITEMQFTFGKPGQVVGGLQYGLSFLTAHDHARIYLPSYLGFGESGNSSGLIPPRTPIFFEVEVVEVR